MSDSGIAREKLAWFPTINYGACRADLECLNNCPYGVYEWDAATGRPLVAHPASCLLGCTICLQNCKNRAISLPNRKEFRAMVRRLHEAGRIAGTSPRIS
jgi:NAD-dependent dihydropyrimidine dehydrogenase PreA subunit